MECIKRHFTYKPKAPNVQGQQDFYSLDHNCCLPFIMSTTINQINGFNTVDLLLTTSLNLCNEHSKQKSTSWWYLKCGARVLRPLNFCIFDQLVFILKKMIFFDNLFHRSNLSPGSGTQ